MSLKSFMNNLFKGNDKNNNLADSNNYESIKAPMSGQVLKLSEIKDPAFSSEMIGKGLAINPNNGKVCSPVDGKVSMLFETNHAIGITSDKGLDILIHIGMDTVELKGKGFSSSVKNGDRIEVGQALIDVDLDLLKAEGYDIVTPIVITNVDKIKDLVETSSDQISIGEELFKIKL